jgi:23S rRNA pseudouridine1911/1915/1917 synthase
LSVQLETGRTHQIRVHMAYRGFPLVGDSVYGRRLVLPKSPLPELIETLQGFRRQALHACLLGLTHPVSGEWLEWEATMPKDMQGLCEVLRKDAEHGKSNA